MLEFLEIINPNGGECLFEEAEHKGDVYVYKFTYTAQEKTVPSQITVRWRIPSVGIFTTWNPVTKLNKALRTVVTAGIPGAARVSDGAPVQALIGHNGRNTVTFAVSDAVTPIETNTQIYEDGMGMTCEVKFFVLPVRAMDKYEAYVRIDFSDIPYYEALKNVGIWWREDCGYKEAYVPEFAKDILYSTWYSYHHLFTDAEIVEQCKAAYEMGMKNIILDGGWSVLDKDHRGYGDYYVNRNKIKDMAAMVDEIHKIGMKFMLWFSVPFISRDTECWHKLNEYVLDPEPDTVWHCLDPRYKEVREYIIGVFERSVKEWNLDGLKLDFINSFNLSEYSRRKDERRDIECLEDAVAQLVDEIGVRLKSIKPDILIEFRQPYAGPKTLETGNMIRVNDCPNDALFNRVGSIDLRLLTGKTAVHSDMIGWNKNDTPKGVARQLIGVLFSVPQISVKIEEQSEKQYKTLKFYMDFYTRHRAELIDGSLIPLNPQANYSIVIGEKDNAAVAVCYSNNYISLGGYEKLAIVNGTEEGTIILDSAVNSYDKNATIYDCMGNIVQNKKITIDKGINVLEIPPCGIIEMN